MKIPYAFPVILFCSFRIEEKGLFEFVLYDRAGSVVDEGKAINELTLGNNLKKGEYIVKIQSESGSKFYKLAKD